MTNEDRVLYELRFSYQGLSDEEGNFYIDLIRHIKEVTDSEINIDFIELNDDKYKLKYHIKNTPALVIDEKVFSEGKVLTEREIKKLLVQE